MTGTVAGVGAGFALLRGPALEFAAWHSAGAPGRLTLYRMAERAVGLAGLLVAATLTGGVDGDVIIDALGILVIVGLLIFSFVVAAAGNTRRESGNDGSAA